MDINNKGKIDLKMTKKRIVESWREKKWLDPKRAVVETLENMEKELGEGEVHWTQFLHCLNPALITDVETSTQSKCVELMSEEERKALLYQYSRMDPDGDGYVTENDFQAYMMANWHGILGKKVIGLFLIFYNSAYFLR